MRNELKSLRCGESLSTLIMKKTQKWSTCHHWTTVRLLNEIREVKELKRKHKLVNPNIFVYTVYHINWESKEREICEKSLISGFRDGGFGISLGKVHPWIHGQGTHSESQHQKNPYFFIIWFLEIIIEISHHMLHGCHRMPRAETWTSPPTRGRFFL